MIPQNIDVTPTWQQILSQAYRDPNKMLSDLLIPLDADCDVDKQAFQCLVPKPFAARMTPGDRHDPLLLQVLPLQTERATVAGFSADPLSEKSQGPVPGIIHKFKHRALWIVSGACAVHCRYCFRRHYPYADNLGQQALLAVNTYLAEQTSLKEVILSGGDPLTLSDKKLAQTLDLVSSHQHIQWLRIHTRLPVLIPQRVTKGLCQLLKASRFKPIIVLHINHPNEIDESVIEACRRLIDAGCLLFNQSVLLKSINDNVETLVRLSERCIDAGIAPYYLHTLDAVQGAHHFNVSIDEAKTLWRALLCELPGYMVPKLVKESPFSAHKIPLF